MNFGAKITFFGRILALKSHFSGAEVADCRLFKEVAEAVYYVVYHHFAEQPVVHSARYALQHLVVH